MATACNETPAQAQAWLAEGRACLAAGDRSRAAEWLVRAREHPVTRLHAHNLIEREGLEGAFSAWMGLPCEIAEADDIFRFFENHPSCVNPLRDYLADGWRTLAELLLLLEQVDKPLLGVNRFLEFASGHGRFTRHLIKAIGVQRVVVSDVVSDAMRFAETTFGVEARLSSAQPRALTWPERYDVVFVLSLFSHLPLRTWGDWLSTLWQAVGPGGVLVFSTHGLEAVRRAGVTLDEQGFHFTPSSESNAINQQEYGTAFTSDSFVRGQIAERASDHAKLIHLPVYFWHHQDAYALVRETE